MALKSKNVVALVAVCVACVCGAKNVSAYVPEIVEQASLHDISIISDPSLSQVFYGELTGQPHTYEIRAESPFVLSVQIRVPDIEAAKNTVSGIVVKEQRKGRVQEITRFKAEDATWEIFNDSLTGEAYREGASFEKELEAGVYHIEIHTPDNLEKYMFKVGKENDMTIGYFELLHRLVLIKDFYGVSRFWIIESPYVYWPLLVLGGLGGYAMYLWKRKTHLA